MFKKLPCPCSSAIFKEQPRSAQNQVLLADRPYQGKPPFVQQQLACIITAHGHKITAPPSLKQLLKSLATSRLSLLCELRRIAQIPLKLHNPQMK